MEGVLVSAKKEGSTITITVVSDDKGQFSFPASKLDAGKYNITIRAIGYKLDGREIGTGKYCGNAGFGRAACACNSCSASH